jgi:hypothetical protein
MMDALTTPEARALMQRAKRNCLILIKNPQIITLEAGAAIPIGIISAIVK